MRTVAAAQAPDHGPWDQLLRRRVKAGLVDYPALKADRAALDRYLSSLAATNPSMLSKESQLAFWINAYNACVVKGVLDRYPLESVKDVKGFFDKITYQVAGEALTLNQIEAKGRTLGDWRIHFAVVCASSSCPPLRSEAYVPERLNEQLGEQASQFLSDPQRGLRAEGATLWLSQIFKWYTADFVPGEGGPFHKLTPDKLLPIIQPYLSPQTAQAIEGLKLSIKFLDYDWSLNLRR